MFLFSFLLILHFGASSWLPWFSILFVSCPSLICFVSSSHENIFEQEDAQTVGINDWVKICKNQRKLVKTHSSTCRISVPEFFFNFSQKSVDFSKFPELLTMNPKLIIPPPPSIHSSNLKKKYSFSFGKYLWLTVQPLGSPLKLYLRQILTLT